MNARMCVHAQKPYSYQAVLHESSKVEGRGKREEDRRQEAKLIRGNKTRPTQKLRGERLSQLLISQNASPLV